MNYSITHKTTGEWLGAVHGVDSAEEARREWADSFGREQGIDRCSVKAARLPDNA